MLHDVSYRLCNLTYKIEGSYFNPVNNMFLNLTKLF